MGRRMWCLVSWLAGIATLRLEVLSDVFTKVWKFWSFGLGIRLVEVNALDRCRVCSQCRW